MFNGKTNKTEFTSVNEHDQAGPSTSRYPYPRVRPNTAIGGKGDTILHTIARNRDGFIDNNSKALCHNGLITKNADGNTPIHLAAESGNIDFLRVGFWEINGDEIARFSAIIKISDKNNSGKTPFHLASEGRHWQCVKLLLEEMHTYAGIKDNQGKTPLHIIVSSQKTSDEKDIYYDLVKELLKVVDDDKDNSLHNCIKESGDKELIILFILHYGNKQKDLGSKLEQFSKQAKSKEKISKQCNIGAAATSGVSGMGEFVGLLKKIKFILEVISVSNGLSAIAVPIALFAYNSAAKQKKKCNELSNEIESYKTKTSELREILKDLEHKEHLANLEINLQRNNQNLLQMKNELSRHESHCSGSISQSLDPKNQRAESTGTLMGIPQIVESCPQDIVSSSRKEPHALDITQHKRFNRRPSLQVVHKAHTSQDQGTSGKSVAPTSRPADSQNQESFRLRSSSWGTHFRKEKNGNTQPKTLLHSPRSSSVSSKLSK